MMYNISITESAANQFKLAMKEAGLNKIRVSVAGGGCSGFQYVLDINEEVHYYDIEFVLRDVNFVIDEFSFIYLNGFEIDYIDALDGGFKFNNISNEYLQRQCGCGKSFGV